MKNPVNTPITARLLPESSACDLSALSANMPITAAENPNNIQYFANVRNIILSGPALPYSSIPVNGRVVDTIPKSREQMDSFDIPIKAYYTAAFKMFTKNFIYKLTK